MAQPRSPHLQREYKYLNSSVAISGFTHSKSHIIALQQGTKGTVNKKCAEVTGLLREEKRPLII